MRNKIKDASSKQCAPFVSTTRDTDFRAANDDNKKLSEQSQAVAFQRVRLRCLLVHRHLHR